MYKSLLETTNNTRALSGKIWRTDAVNELSAADKLMLMEKGLTEFIDMRTDDEVKKRPCAMEGESDFTYHHLPISEGAAPPSTLEGVPLSYMRIAQAKNIAAVFHAIADASDGVLFGCTAGKDRTGVVSAVLQLLRGDDEVTIINVYVISREYNKKRLEEYLASHPEADREVVLANEKSMEKFLGLFREKFGTAENYLHTLGLSEQEIQILRDKMTV